MAEVYFRWLNSYFGGNSLFMIAKLNFGWLLMATVVILVWVAESYEELNEFFMKIGKVHMDENSFVVLCVCVFLLIFLVIFFLFIWYFLFVGWFVFISFFVLVFVVTVVFWGGGGTSNVVSLSCQISNLWDSSSRFEVMSKALDLIGKDLGKSSLLD